jgi:hypothetical protein
LWQARRPAFEITAENQGMTEHRVCFGRVRIQLDGALRHPYSLVERPVTTWTSAND